MKKFYFAHPINIYSHPLEHALMIFIAHQLTGGDLDRVENPNQKHHREGYLEYAERYKHEPISKGTRGMRYFYEKVLPLCGSGCVSFAFLDGRLGLGVASEAERFIDENLPSLLIESTREVTSLDLNQFIDNPADSNLFHIRPFTRTEFAMICDVDVKVGNSLVIPHEETRLRTWFVYNKESRPYEEAHLVKMPIPEGFYPEDK